MLIHVRSVARLCREGIEGRSGLPSAPDLKFTQDVTMNLGPCQAIDKDSLQADATLIPGEMRLDSVSEFSSRSSLEFCCKPGS